MKREDAVRLSFMMSVPAVLGAVVLKAPALIRSKPTFDMISVYLFGCAAALAAGLLCIKLIVFISGKSKFKYFSFYCFMLGAYAVYRGIRG